MVELILLSRLGGEDFALNPDLIERAEATPDTVVTLVSGNKYVIAQSLDELIELISLNRAQVIASAEHLNGQTRAGSESSARPLRSAGSGRDPIGHTRDSVVSLYPKES
jgi:flagellar protein FlbD